MIENSGGFISEPSCNAYTASVTNCLIEGQKDVPCFISFGASSITVNIGNNMIRDNTGTSGIKIDVSPVAPQTFSVDIHDNILSFNQQSAIEIDRGGGVDDGSVSITNNLIRYSLSSSILLNSTMTSSDTFTLNIGSNSLSYSGGNGISLFSGSNFLSATITDNTVFNHNFAGASTLLFNGVNSVLSENNVFYDDSAFIATARDQAFYIQNFDPATLCLDLENNTSDTGYLLRNDNGTASTFNLAPNGIPGAQLVNTGAVIQDPTQSGSTIEPVSTCGL
jgi:hypothetical protein